jgi:hypothetical protein
MTTMAVGVMTWVSMGVVRGRTVPVNSCVTVKKGEGVSDGEGEGENVTDGVGSIVPVAGNSVIGGGVKVNVPVGRVVLVGVWVRISVGSLVAVCVLVGANVKVFVGVLDGKALKVPIAASMAVSVLCAATWVA